MRAGGCDAPGYPTIYALLAEFGVPSFAVFDGDEGCEARARSKDPRGEKSEEIAKERQKQAEENRRLLKYFQADQIEDFPQTAVLEAAPWSRTRWKPSSSPNGQNGT